MPITSKHTCLSATQLFYNILIKKARNFAGGCPQNSPFSQLCGSLGDLIEGHRHFTVDKVTALADDTERGGHARHVYRETERNGRSIGRRVEGMLHHRPGDDRTVLLQLQNDVEREVHARSGREVAVERHRVNAGVLYGKVAVPGRMRDARTRRSSVQIKQQRIARCPWRAWRGISRQQLRIRRTRSTRRACGAGWTSCTGCTRCARGTGGARHAGTRCSGWTGGTSGTGGTSRYGNLWEYMSLFRLSEVVEMFVADKFVIYMYVAGVCLTVLFSDSNKVYQLNTHLPRQRFTSSILF